MEREARTRKTLDYAGNREEQTCPSNARKTLDNQCYKASTGNRIRSKQQRLEIDKLGGRGPPKGGRLW